MSKRVDPVKIGMFVGLAMLLFFSLLMFFSSSNIFSRNVRFYTFFDTSLNGLDLGAPVKFKGVRIGSVEAIDIIHDEDTDEACASVLIKVNSSAFRTINGHKVVDNDYDAFFAEQISHGMAAQLAMDSVVTGKKFVSIDYYSHDSERFFKDIDGLKYQQMPSMSTGLDEFLAGVDTVMQNISKLDLGAISENIDEVLVKLSHGLDEIDFHQLNRSFIDACDGFSGFLGDEKVKQILETIHHIAYRVDQRLDKTMDNLDHTMEQVSDFVRSDSNFRENLEDSLLQFGRTLRSIREFFDLLERVPNSVLAGKSS